jgi:hypothetical protein
MNFRTCQKSTSQTVVATVPWFDCAEKLTANYILVKGNVIWITPALYPPNPIVEIYGLVWKKAKYYLRCSSLS